MANYWSEFLLVALAHFVAVASPGPDFRDGAPQSVTFGRRPRDLDELGIGTGIFLHVAYSLSGSVARTEFGPRVQHLEMARGRSISPGSA